jgi:uncharacterized protein
MSTVKHASTMAILVSLAWIGSANHALAQAKKSDSVVKIKAEADKPGADGTTTIRLALTIDPGWHIYANPVGQEDLADTATTVTADGAGKVESVQYPEGKAVKDKVLGVYKVYEDKVTITAKVRRPADGKTMDLAVKIQACNETKCLVPATVKISLP